jgi:alpha-tubulin suppressor-like RCC1 family protein
MALTDAGLVYCWGDNTFGQLGVGTAARQVEPVRVVFSGSLSGATFRAIATGRFHCLAVTEDGRVAAWGVNSRGQIGDGSFTNRWSPVEVRLTAGVSEPIVTAVAAGDEHSLALTSDGRVFAWGRNSDGQLGIGALGSTSLPSLVPVSGVRLVAAGGSHSLAAGEDGRVWAWGRNAEGQLGTGTYDASLLPALVRTSAWPPGAAVTALSGGVSHSVALTTDGGVFAWGLNSSGQLGDGRTVSRNVPASVTSVTGFTGRNAVGIAAGDSHSLAVTSAGVVFAWGSNVSSELGDGSTQTRLVPVSLSARGVLSGQASTLVAAGGGFSVAEVNASQIPTPPVATTVAASSVGLNEAVLNATVSVTGGPASVRFEYGTTLAYGSMARPTPNVIGCSASVPVSVLVGRLLPDTTYHYRVVAENGAGVSTSENRTFTTTHSMIAGWGRNEGRLNSQGQPIQRVPIGCPLTGYMSRRRVSAISAGENHTVVLDATGVPFAWGNSYHVGLGVSSTGVVDSRPLLAGSPSPRQLPDELVGVPISAASVGNYHSCIVTQDGRLYGFGANDSGQLGIGSVTPQGIPQRFLMPPLEGSEGRVISAVAGNRYTLMVRDDGRVLGCGTNSNGIVGPVESPNRLLPGFVSGDGLAGGRKVRAVSSVNGHALAINENGRVFAWGANSNGQLGDGTTNHSAQMVAVTGLGIERFAVVAAGYTHSLALSESGRLYAWGSNAHGELGNGTTTSSLAPVAVVLPPELSGVVIRQIVAGDEFSALLTVDGRVFTWGSNQYGQIGDGTSVDRLVPGAVDTSGVLQGMVVTQISAGQSYLLALASNKFAIAGAALGQTGIFELSFFSEAGVRYEIQAGLDSLQYSTIGSVRADGPLTRWFDTAVPGRSRFYRIVQR